MWNYDQASNVIRTPFQPAYPEQVCIADGAGERLSWLRASHEEDYTRQTRGMYLAGLYHRAGKGEINELVNLPDVVGMEIAINGEVFSLSHEAWQRELDFASGELRRNVVWRTSNGSGYTIASRRFVSADQLPLIALEITITPLDADASVLISTGIDATQTNHGRQHLDETQVRVFGQHLMQGSYTTQMDAVMWPSAVAVR